MLRLIGNGYFAERVLIAIFHPLEHSCRQIQLSSLEEVMKTGLKDQHLQANPYRNAFSALFFPSSQRLSLLASYILYALFAGFREHRRRELNDEIYRNYPSGELPEGAVDGCQERADGDLVALLDVLHVIPTSNIISVCTSLLELKKLDEFVVKPYLQLLDAKPMGDLFFVQMNRVLERGQSYSLTTIQVRFAYYHNHAY
jgi:hypothetical protein